MEYAHKSIPSPLLTSNGPDPLMMDGGVQRFTRKFLSFLVFLSWFFFLLTKEMIQIY
jgi:hypothetical protein